MKTVTIIGSGLAGLSAAYTLAKQNIPCSLISRYHSERAQSVLAEGGINAALDTMGQDDSPDLHFEETMKAGVYLADPNAVYGLTHGAPEIVRGMAALGVPFNRQSDGRLMLRSFGGQKKKRTAYAKSSTGKMLMSSLIDAVRRFEAKGLVTRYPHHELDRLVIDPSDAKKVRGVRVRNSFTDEELLFPAPVILAMGGLNGMFPELTTGTTANSCDATGMLFLQGLEFGNLEMIQYHPTTLKICSKLCLVSEAARGEGGRLFTERDGKRWYFMEEKYPELGNLMPRDVVSREEYFVMHDPENPSPVYLDMTVLPEETWKKKLPDLRKEIIEYKGKDPKKEPIRIDPGIHYFMGGIDVDEHHRTNLTGLYAAGECCNQYHGANRLGGNSLLGAIYGGKTAAEEVLRIFRDELKKTENVVPDQVQQADFTAAQYNRASEQGEASEHEKTVTQKPAEDTSANAGQLSSNQTASWERVSDALIAEVTDVLSSCMGIVREQKELEEGLRRLDEILGRGGWNEKERGRILLAKAMISSAVFRKESRGAHYRSDYPQPEESYRKTQLAAYEDGQITIRQRDIPQKRP